MVKEILPLFFLLITEFSTIPKPKATSAIVSTILVYTILLFFCHSLLKKWIAKIPFSKIFLLAALIFSFLLLITYLPIDPERAENDPKDYHSLAKNLLSFGSFCQTNPQGECQPTTFRPIGYPFFIATVYKISGNFDPKNVKIAQFLLYLLSLFLLWQITNEIVVLFYSLNLPLLLITNNYWSETLSQFLLILFIFFCVKIDRLNQSKKSFKKVFFACLNGLIGGLLILTRPAYIFYFPFFALYVIYELLKKVSLLKTLTFTMILITVTLWSTRNSKIADRKVLISTNGGMNLYLGNNPYVFNGKAAFWPPGEYLAKTLGEKYKEKDFNKIQRNIGTTSAKEEAEVDSAFTKSAIDWIKKNPYRFLLLSFNKIQNILIPDIDIFDSGEHSFYIRSDQHALLVLSQSTFFWIILLLAIIGLFNSANIPLLFWSIPYLFSIIVSFSQFRFQLPLYILLSFFAAKGLEYLPKIKLKPLPNRFLLEICLYVIHLFFFAHSFTAPFKQWFHERKKNINAYHVIDKYPSSVYLINSTLKESEGKFIVRVSNLLFYKNKKVDINDFEEIRKNHHIYTSNIDIFRNIYDPKYMENYYLEFVENDILPVFIVKDKATALNKNVIEEAVSSDWFGQEKEFFLEKINQNLKLISMRLTIGKGNKLKIIGKEELTFEGFPINQSEIFSEIYFPSSFFEKGLTIKIYNFPVPVDSHHLSIDTFSRFTTSLNNAQVTKITEIY